MKAILGLCLACMVFMMAGGCSNTTKGAVGGGALGAATGAGIAAISGGYMGYGALAGAGAGAIAGGILGYQQDSEESRQNYEEGSYQQRYKESRYRRTHRNKARYEDYDDDYTWDDE